MDVKKAIERLRQDEDEMNGLCEEIIESRNEAIETVLSELEKKDEIINLMAKYMASGNSYMYATAEDIKEDFTNKVEKEGK